MQNLTDRFLRIWDICGDHIAISQASLLFSLAVSWVPGVRAILFLKLLLILIDLIVVLRDLWRL
jgi:hypothetical protein